MNLSIAQYVLASGNAGKIREFNALLSSRGIDIKAQSKFNVPDIEETGLSFVENAILKARNAAQHTGLPALADDSGIEVDALKGKPGIYSARYADPNANDQTNNQKLLHELTGIPEDKRSARYQCVIVLFRHPNDPMPLICQGSWEGIILDNPRGEYGFGYDPLFYVPTHHCSAAELDPIEKNKISHRAIALKQLDQHFKRI